MAHLSLSLLGPFAAELAGQTITAFESNKVRALLAYLAVEADQPHRRDSLAALFWLDLPDRAARQNLRHALSNLRKAIGDHEATPPYLIITRDTIQFNTASDHWLDVTALNSLAQVDQRGSAVSHQWEGGSDADQLEAAVALYRGPFLEGFVVKGSSTFDDWALLWRERLHRWTMSLLRELVELYERRAEYQLACAFARRRVDLEPWQEEAHQQLMRQLALSGERSAALVQYEVCRRTLAEELDVEPAEETFKLYALIREGELGAPTEGLLSPATPLHNLPVSLDPFVGRQAELDEIRGLLEDRACRLLTLAGPGGSGKTRLAVEAARTLACGFEEGKWFVPLAPVQSAEAMILAIGQAVGFSFSAAEEPLQQLLDYLRPEEMLLILDNFEHLLDGVGTVADLLRTAPKIKVLVTSRTTLKVHGEHVLSVGGMEYPRLAADLVVEEGMGDSEEPLSADAQSMTEYGAVELFRQTAARVHAGFEPSPEELADVAHICGLVEGMPLGILLAAAWVDVLRPAEIRAEIESGLDFLQTQWHDLPDRHRSLRAVFDHSWNLLGQQERSIVRMLSVFRGGFTREAAEEVAGATLPRLQDLVQKSFVQYRPTPSALPGRAGRYEIHELLRHYAAEKLAESPSTWESAVERHSAHYAGTLQRCASELKGPQRQAVLSEMDADIDNLRAAWGWAALHGHVERLEEAMEGLQLFYWLRGRYLEGEAAMRQVTSSLDSETDAQDQLRVRARASIWQSQFCHVLGNREQAAELQNQVRALLDGPEMADDDTRFERALLLLAIGRTVWWSDQARASRLLMQALPLLRELDDPWRLAEALAMLGRGAVFTGAVDQGVQWLRESMALYQDHGDDGGSATSMAYLSNAALASGRLAEAEDLARQAARISLQRGSRAEYVHKLGVLGYALAVLGKYTEAHEVLEKCIKIRQGQAARYHNAHARSSLSAASLHLGRYAEASAHATVALADARETGVRHAVGSTLTVLACVALVQGRYAKAHERAREAIEAFREWGDMYYSVQALSVLGLVARADLSYRQAKLHVVEGLSPSLDLDRRPARTWVLPVAALLLADEGRGTRAVELYALAQRYPYVANSRWVEDVAGRHIARAVASLPASVAAKARERGQALDLGETVTEVLAELGEA